MKKLLILILFLLPLCCQGAFNIVINEVAWMGTETSYNDEWIELKNLGEETVSLKGWVLKAEDGSPEINLEGEITGFYLLERTDDETVPGITANLIYTGSLKNTGETLKLYDFSKNIVDQVVSLEESWPAGDNNTKQTMERNNNSWQTSYLVGGTPGGENSQGSSEIISEDIIQESIPLQTKNYPFGIVFSELMPSPEGPDQEEEYIQLFNENSFKVNLNGWTIEDKEGRVISFSINKEIEAKGYLAFLRPETGITLNNSGDGLELKNPNGEVVDSVNYPKASLGEPYIKKGGNWSWGSQENNYEETTQEDIVLGKEIISQKGKAQIGEKLKEGKSPFLIALVLALIFSSLAIVIKRSFTL